VLKLLCVGSDAYSYTDERNERKSFKGQRVGRNLNTYKLLIFLTPLWLVGLHRVRRDHISPSTFILPLTLFEIRFHYWRGYSTSARVVGAHEDVFSV